MSNTILNLDEEYDKYWNSLSKEDQLKAFYSVCKRIHKGDVIDRGSYRWVLYDVFEFGPESYIVGMDCGYMSLHNYICDGVEMEKTSKGKK